MTLGASLLAIVGADADPLVQSLNQAERDIKKWGRSVEGALNSLRAPAESLALLMGVGIAGGVAALVKETLDSVSALEAHAKALDINVESYQGLRFAAAQSELGVEEFDKGLELLNTKLGEARSHNQAAIDSFAKWKINVGPGHDLTDVLGQIADRLKSIQDPAQRFAASADLINQKVGRDFVNFLSQGSQGIDAWISKASEMGAVLSEETIKKGAAANNELKAMGQLIGVQLARVLIDILPSIQNMAKALNLLAVSAHGLKELLEGFAPTSERSFGRLTDDLSATNKEIDRLQNQMQYRKGLPGILQGDLSELDLQIAKRQAEKKIIVEQMDALRALDNVEKPKAAYGSGFSPVNTDAIKNIEKGEKALDDYIAKLANLHDMNSLSARDQAVQRDLDQAESIARRYNIDLTQEQIDAIKQLSAANYDHVQSVQAFKEVTHELASSVSTEFQNLVSGTENWGQALRNLALDLTKVAEKALIMKPLEDALSRIGDSLFGGVFGSGGGSGIFSSLESLFGGGDSAASDFSADFPTFETDPWAFDLGDLPSFDIGTPYVPQDMVAKIHKGERIVPAAQNRGGNFGGPTFYIDARGADAQGMADLQATIKRLNGKIESYAGKGVTEARVQEALSRGQMSA
ncbi:MAG TPA: hypothetical protein VHB73_01540 [Alphaproteobacteria bacterium]|nr:hypothetical protein [Alphaproteobacteria bacterium]